MPDSKWLKNNPELKEMLEVKCSFLVLLLHIYVDLNNYCFLMILIFKGQTSTLKPTNTNHYETVRGQADSCAETHQQRTKMKCFPSDFTDLQPAF